jgi:hypothetical protein
MSGTDKDPEAGAGDPPEADSEPPKQVGVLGNLPKKRPAVRSPRRSAAKQASGSEQPPPAKPRKPPPAPPRREPEGAPEHSRAADLEGLARGGIAVAGGAASLGLRIAGRAAAALRDAVERR